MDLQQYLDTAAPYYSEELHLIGSVTHSPGYHTRIPDGQWSHQTRQSLDYALALLMSGAPANVARANDIVAKIVSLQDTEPTNSTYGIWSWYYEEPLPKMAPPDWNWADFIGARLLQIVHGYSDKLSPEIVASVRSAIGHAGWSIFRRNVNTGYTNIAVMGGGVSLAAGELLGEPRLVDYGRRKLANVVANHTLHGDFNEYNSPTYTIVVLEEADRFLSLLKDESGRDSMEKLRYVAWRTISEHFHPGTQQWTGPNIRAYSDRLSVTGAQFLSERLPIEIKPHASVLAGDPPLHTELITPIPCPDEFVGRFSALPEDDYTIVRRYNLDGGGGRELFGTTWFSQDAALGSSNRGGFWNQSRATIGHWKTDSDSAIVFRTQFLHDGRDFCSVWMENAQAGPRILTAATLEKGHGDFHPSLDGPKDGIYRAEDFRLRISLSGVGTAVKVLSATMFELSAGGHKAVVHVAPSLFDGQPVRWEAGQGASGVYLDAVCYSGPSKGFDLDKVGDTAIVFATEILAANAAPSLADPVTATADGRLVATWAVDGGLSVDIPLRP
ncbi:MAG TPA: hypothetical protein VGK19_05645 [Capsulimonadaceae bacterium]|jgi:hypothetical protein